MSLSHESIKLGQHQRCIQDVNFEDFEWRRLYFPLKINSTTKKRSSAPKCRKIFAIFRKSSSILDKVIKNSSLKWWIFEDTAFENPFSILKIFPTQARSRLYHDSGRFLFHLVELGRNSDRKFSSIETFSTHSL